MANTLFCRLLPTGGNCEFTRPRYSDCQASARRQKGRSVAYTVTNHEIEGIVIHQNLARLVGRCENKSLEFHYNLQIQLAWFTVSNRDGIRVFERIDDAIKAYNDA